MKKWGFEVVWGSLRFFEMFWDFLRFFEIFWDFFGIFFNRKLLKKTFFFFGFEVFSRPAGKKKGRPGKNFEKPEKWGMVKAWCWKLGVESLVSENLMPKNFSALRAAWCPCPSRPSQKKNVKNNFLRCAQHGAPTLPPPSQKKKVKIFFCAARSMVPLPLPPPARKKRYNKIFSALRAAWCPYPGRRTRAQRLLDRLVNRGKRPRAKLTDGPGGF